MSKPDEQYARRRAVILTVLAEEYRAVRAHVCDLVEKVNQRGTVYEIGTFDTPAGSWEVVLAQIGTGDAAASIVVERAVLDYKPAVLLMVGIAAGVRNRVRPGDVVVATDVYSYESGKLRSSGEFHRTSVGVSSHRMQQRAIKEATRGTWVERRIDPLPGDDSPAVHLGPIASGEKAIATGRWPETLNGKLLAVDMESYGVLSAIRDANVDALIVRGIADFADGSKSDDWQKAAAINASAFAFEVIARLNMDVEPSSEPIGEHREDLAQRYISQFSIENLRSVTEVNWQIARGPGWHVLIGHNGAGKTTVLRAIALALFSRRETDALRQDWSNWLAAGRDGGRISVTLAGSSELTSVDRSVGLMRAVDRSIELGAVEETGNGRETPADVFSAGYGPFRRFSGGDPEYEEQIRLWPHLLRHLTLFKESAALAESLTWLKDLRFKQLEGHLAGEFLDSVKVFVNGSDLLPQGVRLSQVSSEAVTFVDAGGFAVEIQELSDGFRSMLSLVLDLVRHMAAAYGPSGVFSRSDPQLVAAPGIVLIDEVDVHLHPTWQHRIGDWFREHFPAVQFLIATHSLLICQSADTVYLLPRPGTEDEARMLAGIELDRIRYGNVLDAYSTGVFGVGVDRSEESKKMLLRLATLNARELEEDLTPGEAADQEHLRAVLPTATRLSDNGAPELRE